MRRPLILAIALAAAFAAPAHASTLVNAGGTLTFTGDDAVNKVTFSGMGNVLVDRDPSDGDPLQSATGCGPGTPGRQYSCLAVSRVVVVLNGGADIVTATTLSLPATI